MLLSPRKFVVFFTFLIGVLIFVALLLYKHFFYTIQHHTLTIIIITITFTVLFFKIFTKFFYKYIYERIRIIYKTILKEKKLEKPKPHQADILQKAQEDVEQWVRTQEKEIQDLKKLETYRREFLGNVSHELKTPLTAIQGYVYTLLEGGLYDPVINMKYLRRAAKNIERLVSIVSDLEAISKYEAGEIKLNIQKFNIVDLILEVFDTMEIKAKKASITLEYNGNPYIPIHVLADQEKIRQVLINLIDNSITYGIENGKTKVSIFDMEDHYLVELSDNGIGIEKDELPRIFERFYRSRSGRQINKKGSGLGLAIVKHIIEAHNQHIFVRSTKGIGTTFGFTLMKFNVQQTINSDSLKNKNTSTKVIPE